MLHELPRPGRIGIHGPRQQTAGQPGGPFSSSVIPRDGLIREAGGQLGDPAKRFLVAQQLPAVETAGDGCERPVAHGRSIIPQ
ncbi:MAG: hypothetical protein J5I93_00565 [Pirellulaceae bacterium]|nr:hypothetical protein [Pirellulaceae bacterium]